MRLQVAWGPILPQDRGRIVREELLLVEGGLHSRHRAMTAVGVEDPALEAARIREEGVRLSSRGSGCQRGMTDARTAVPASVMPSRTAAPRG